MPIDPNIALQGQQVQPPDLLGNYMKMAQLKNLLAQGLQHDLATQQMQQQLTDTRTMRDLASKHMVTDPNTGQKTFDEQGFITDLQQANPTAATTYRKGAYETQEANVKMTGQQLAVAKQRLDMISQTYAGLLAKPNVAPQDVATAFQSLAQQGVVPPEAVQAQLQQIPQDPTQIRPFLMQHAMQQMDASKRMELALGDMKDITVGGQNKMFNINRLTGQVTPVANLGANAESGAGKLEQDITNKVIPADQAGAYRKKEQTNMAMMMSGANGLSPQALDMLANLGVQKGEVPQMGMGAAGTAQRVKIANRMAQMGQDGVLPDLGVAGASYKADAGSLAQMQKNRDQIINFERTAGANLDQFLSLAKKMPDMGSQWANKPLRELASGAFGSEAQAAAKTALTVVRPEYAKINQGALNGVLSDSARKEVEATMPDDATYGQFLAAAKVLKQDVANRHQFFDQGINEIKSRIGTSTSKPGMTSATAIPVTDEASYNAVPSGSFYKAKDGSIGRKP
jgi:hypothetical protein